MAHTGEQRPSQNGQHAADQYRATIHRQPV
jgi:hypothetical protein